MFRMTGISATILSLEYNFERPSAASAGNRMNLTLPCGDNTLIGGQSNPDIIQSPLNDTLGHFENVSV